MENKFLKWLSANTITKWWHDSANPDELKIGIDNGACGVTTNPVLVAQSLLSRKEIWANEIAGAAGIDKNTEKAEAILETITCKIASMMYPIYTGSKGEAGYVCAQVNPSMPGDYESMVEMALRLGKWAPNIAVKLPVTAAGLNALEECIARGLTIVATVSFTVPQVIAVAERYEKGLKRAKDAGIAPGKCFAVVMVGRLDDYLRDVAMDRSAGIFESDIKQAGIAVCKRAYSIFAQKGYKAEILPAGMRGAYHATELAGARMVFSVHPKIQCFLEKVAPPFEERIGIPVEEDVIKRLANLSEFNKAYEPDGMKPEDFITYGVTQKTLSQFVETGWKALENYFS